MCIPFHPLLRWPNRLTASDQSGTTNDQGWTLDALGNMSLATTGSTNDYRATNSQNELLSMNATSSGGSTLTYFAYDNDGNTIIDHTSVSGTDTQYELKYDAWNRLTLVRNLVGTTVVAFAYDGQGWKIKEMPSGTTTDLYYSGSWQLLEERTGVTSPSSNGTVKTQNVWSAADASGLVLRDTFVSGSLSERLYFTRDANNDVTGVISTGGTVVERMAYTSYGIVSFLTSSWAAGSDSKSLHTLYQGGRYDSWIDGYDFEHRIYLPEQMRWMTADPLLYVNGPNMYQFVADNPINSTDPTGKSRYISGVVIGHVGVAVDTWRTQAGHWVKTGVKTFDFSVDWDSNWWILGVVAWKGKVTPSDGLNLDSPVTVNSTPCGDIKLLPSWRGEVADPPIYSLLGGIIAQYPNYCIEWSEDRVQLFKDEPCCMNPRTKFDQVMIP